MKNLSHQILLGILISCIFSCKKLVLMSEQIKQPKMENYDSLVKFLISNDMDTTELLCFKDTSALNTFYKTGTALPDSRFFNKNRELVDYRSSAKDCNGSVSTFIEMSDSINRKRSIPDKDIDFFINSTVSAKTGQPFILDSQSYDIYLVIFWAKYLGKVNKHKVFEWQQLAKKANKDGKKIRTILVNADYQSFWGIDKTCIPKFDF